MQLRRDIRAGARSFRNHRSFILHSTLGGRQYEKTQAQWSYAIHTQGTQLVRGGVGIQIPIFWLNPVLFLIHNAARYNDLGTPLPPLVASKLSERLAYALIVFECAVLSIVPFAQELFANLAGSHLIAGMHATGLAEISKV